MIDNPEKRPPVLAWSTLDLFLVSDAVRRVDGGDETFEAFEDFCRELRRARSDWQFFATPEPTDDYRLAGLWLVGLADGIMERINAVREQVPPPPNKTWDLLTGGVERHRKILENALSRSSVAA